MMKDKGPWRCSCGAICATLLPLQCRDAAFLAPHLWKRTRCFSAFPTCGVLTLSVVFQARRTSFTWLPAPAGGLEGVVVMETGHWGGTRLQAPAHALKSFHWWLSHWADFRSVTRLPTEAAQRLVRCADKRDGSGFFKVAVSMCRFNKCQTSVALPSSVHHCQHRIQVSLRAPWHSLTFPLSVYGHLYTRTEAVVWDGI